MLLIIINDEDSILREEKVVMSRNGNQGLTNMHLYQLCVNQARKHEEQEQ